MPMKLIKTSVTQNEKNLKRKKKVIFHLQPLSLLIVQTLPPIAADATLDDVLHEVVLLPPLLRAF